MLDIIPGILGGLLEPERNPLLLPVDLDDHDLDLFALLQHFARVRNAPPAHVGDVEEAIHAVQIDERAEIGDVLDDALADLPRLDALQQVAPLLVALFLDQLAPGQHDILPVEVDLEDFEIVGLPDVLIEVLRRLDVDVRRRQEGIHADADDEAALDLGLHPSGDHGAFGAFLENVVPVLLLLRQVVGDDRVAVPVLEFLQDDFDLRTDLQLPQIAELRRRDDALRFPADVDDNLVLADFGDSTWHDRAFLQRIEGALREQFFHD